MAGLIGGGQAGGTTGRSRCEGVRRRLWAWSVYQAPVLGGGRVSQELPVEELPALALTTMEHRMQSAVLRSIHCLGNCRQRKLPRSYHV